MPLVPTPVTLSSLSALHTLRLSGDASNALVSTLLPRGASPVSVAHFVKQSEREMRNPRSTSRLLQMVDSETGEVVCYNSWSFFVGVKAGEAGGEGKGGGEESKVLVETWPEDAYVEAIHSIQADGNKMREKWLGEETMRVCAFLSLVMAEYFHMPWFYLKFLSLTNPQCLAYTVSSVDSAFELMFFEGLATLVTVPKHRRKGAASQLISIGLALADAHHLPTYVESTPEGRGLYLKHGFEQVDTMVIDLAPWGTPIAQKNTILIRPAAPVLSPYSISISPYLINADFLDFAKIEAKAFSSSPFGRVLLPLPPDPKVPKDFSKKDGMEVRAASLLEMAISDPTVRYLKAFATETHQIVGWAKWNFYLDPSNPPQPTPMEWPPGANIALGEHFAECLYKPRDSHMRGKAYFFMHILCVLPEYQRKGIGKKMLEWGLKQADKLGVECWIDATPVGLGLYKKYGWEEVNTTTIDLEPYGGEPGEKEVNVQLIRLPQPL